MERITNKHIDGLCERLNRITNNPLSYWDESGEKRKTAIGHYCISSAYGGVELQQVCNEFGGVRTPLSSGHVSKRELYNLMHAYIRGIEAVTYKEA